MAFGKGGKKGALNLGYWKLSLVNSLFFSAFRRVLTDFPNTLTPWQLQDIKWKHMHRGDQEFITKFFEHAEKDSADLLKTHFNDFHSRSMFQFKVKLDFLNPQIKKLVDSCNPGEDEFMVALSPVGPLSLPAPVFRSARITSGATKFCHCHAVLKPCDKMKNYLDREGHLNMLKYGGYIWVNDTDQVIGASTLIPSGESVHQEDTSVGLWFDEPLAVKKDEVTFWNEKHNGEERWQPAVYHQMIAAGATHWAYVMPYEVWHCMYGGFLYKFDAEKAQFHGDLMVKTTGNNYLFYPIGLGENIGMFPDGFGPFSLVKSQLHMQDADAHGMIWSRDDSYWEANRENLNAQIRFERSDLDVRIRGMVEPQWGPGDGKFGFPLLITNEALTMVDGTPVVREYGMFENQPSRHLMTVFVYPAVDLDTGNGNLVPGNYRTFYKLGEDNLKQYVGMTDGGILFVGEKPNENEHSEAVSLEESCLGRRIEGLCEYYFATLIPDRHGRFKFGRPIAWRHLWGIENVPEGRFFPVTNPNHRAAGAKSYAWITEEDEVRRLPKGIAFRFVDEHRNVAFPLKGGTLVQNAIVHFTEEGLVYLCLTLTIVCCFGFVDALVKKRVGQVPGWMSICPQLTSMWRSFFKADFARNDERVELAEAQ